MVLFVGFGVRTKEKHREILYWGIKVNIYSAIVFVGIGEPRDFPIEKVKTIGSLILKITLKLAAKVFRVCGFNLRQISMFIIIYLFFYHMVIKCG